MKGFYFFLLFTLTLNNAHSQHCPFDGSTAIVIQLKHKTGKPVVNPAFTITLNENPNANADSCTYAAGELRLPFGTIKTSWINKYEGVWVERATEKLKECNFKSEQGYLSVLLNQAQASCMIKNGNDFIYQERNFSILIEGANGSKQSIAVPADSKYKLCTASGKWTRIKPIIVVID